MIDEREEGTKDTEGDESDAARHDQGQEQEPKQAEDDSSTLWDTEQHSDAPGPSAPDRPPPPGRRARRRTARTAATTADQPRRSAASAPPGTGRGAPTDAAGLTCGLAPGSSQRAR